MTEAALTVVGSVVLDLVRSETDDSSREIGFGGVCFNAAVAAARESRAVCFVSTSYRGEIHLVLGALFEKAKVEWRPLGAVAPIPLFEAILGPDGEVKERFEGTLAFDLIEPALVTASAEPGAAILTCNDLSPAQLDAILPSFETSFLLSSSFVTAPELTQLTHRPDYLALNRAELEHAAGRQLRSDDEIGRAAAKLVNETGIAIVTLGRDGAMLVAGADSSSLRLDVSPTDSDDHWIGAGDALFGAFAAAISRGESPERSLAHGLVSAKHFAFRLSSVNADDRREAEVKKILDGSPGWVKFD